MSIKRDMYIYDGGDDTSFYISTTGSAGDMVVVYTAGSGINYDNSSNICMVTADPSGFGIAGFLLSDVVDKDINTEYVNKEKYVEIKDDKVRLLTRGEITTDKVIGTPTAKGSVYPAHSGYVCASQYGGMSAIGTFQGTKDADGYVRIRVDIA